MKKSTKKVLKTAIGACAAFTSAYMLVGNVFYYLTLTRRGINSSIAEKYMKANSNGGADEKTIHLNGELDQGKIWFDRANKEKLVIRSTHIKKNLHADYLLPRMDSDVFVVLIHGYGAAPRNMGVYAKHYYEAGYNIIAPSMNGHADSETQRITMGWEDRLDIIDWINYIVEEYPESKIIVHGVSMGSATTMMALGEELPENVKVAVADCGFTSIWDIFDQKISKVVNIPGDPILTSANTVNKIISGFDMKKASAIEQLKKANVPTLFIHGEEDTFVPFEMLQKLYDAAACEKDMVVIPGAPHARNSIVNPELYWTSVDGFIKKYI